MRNKAIIIALVSRIILSICINITFPSMAHTRIPLWPHETSTCMKLQYINHNYDSIPCIVVLLNGNNIWLETCLLHGQDVIYLQSLTVGVYDITISIESSSSSHISLEVVQASGYHLEHTYEWQRIEEWHYSNNLRDNTEALYTADSLNYVRLQFTVILEVWVDAPLYQMIYIPSPPFAKVADIKDYICYVIRNEINGVECSVNDVQIRFINKEGLPDDIALSFESVESLLLVNKVMDATISHRDGYLLHNLKDSIYCFDETKLPETCTPLLQVLVNRKQYGNIKAPIEIVKRRESDEFPPNAMYWLHSYVAMNCMDKCHFQHYSQDAAKSMEILHKGSYLSDGQYYSYINCHMTHIKDKLHMNDTHCVCENCIYEWRDHPNFLREDNPDIHKLLIYKPVGGAKFSNVNLKLPLSFHIKSSSNHFLEDERFIFGREIEGTYYNEHSCDRVISKPTIIASVYRIRNIFHLIHDVLIPIYIYSMNRNGTKPIVFLSPEFRTDTNILLVSKIVSRAGGIHKEVIKHFVHGERFLSKAYLDGLPGRSCFRDLQIGLNTSNSLIMYSFNSNNTIMDGRLLKNKDEIRRVMSIQTSFNKYLVSSLGYSNSLLPFQDGRSQIVILLRRTMRKILNVGELVHTVIKVFSKKPMLVFLEDLTFSDQLAILTRTKILIAVTGAGLTNIIFMPIRSLIILILPPKIYGMKWVYSNLGLMSNHHVFVYKQLSVKDSNIAWNGEGVLVSEHNDDVLIDSIQMRHLLQKAKTLLETEDDANLEFSAYFEYFYGAIVEPD